MTTSKEFAREQQAIRHRCRPEREAKARERARLRASIPGGASGQHRQAALTWAGELSEQEYALLDRVARYSDAVNVPGSREQIVNIALCWSTGPKPLPGPELWPPAAASRDDVLALLDAVIAKGAIEHRVDTDASGLSRRTDEVYEVKRKPSSLRAAHERTVDALRREGFLPPLEGRRQRPAAGLAGLRAVLSSF
jgi:hypothetical protein